MLEFEEEHRIHEEEEEEQEYYREPEPIPVCKCLTSEPSSEKIPISARKQQILTTVTRTEAYLRDRRIPELIRFMMTKLLADLPNDPVMYTEKLLDDSMLYRSGLGLPPNLYERKFRKQGKYVKIVAGGELWSLPTPAGTRRDVIHMEAVVKSFDPGSRGWLSASQIEKAFASLGLPPPKRIDDKTPSETVVDNLMIVQEKELFHLLAAGSSAPSTDNSPSDASSLIQLN